MKISAEFDGWKIYRIITILIISTMLSYGVFNEFNTRAFTKEHIKHYKENVENCYDCHQGKSFSKIIKNAPDDNTMLYIIDRQTNDYKYKKEIPQ